MERNTNIDFMKFFAVFFVVCIHTGPFNGLEQVSLIINVFARFAVPFFFMTSGYLLGLKSKNENDTFKYFRRSSLKNLKLYFSWVVLYFFFDLLINLLSAIREGTNIKSMIVEYFKLFFDLKILYYGPATGSFHLWYVIVLFWSVVILFLSLKLKKLTALLILSLVLNIVGLFGQSYSALLDISLYTRDTIFYGLFYTTLGYWFSMKQSTLRGKSEFWLMLFGFFSIIQIIEAFILINYFHGALGNYYLSTIPLSVSLFIFTLKSKKINNKVITVMGGQALGIYVMHPIFIRVINIMIQTLGLQGINHSILWNIIFTPLVFCISYFCYKIIKLTQEKMLISARFFKKTQPQNIIN